MGTDVDVDVDVMVPGKACLFDSAMRSLRLFWGPEGWFRGMEGGGAILARVSATDMGLEATAGVAGVAGVVGVAGTGVFTARLGLMEPLFEDLRDCIFP